MTPQAYVHLDNATVRVDVEGEKRLQVPLHHLAGLVAFGNVMISPALMHRLGDEGKSLVLLDEHGRFKARLEGPVSGNILLRQAQHRAANDSKATLELARACVAGKLKTAVPSCNGAHENPPTRMRPRSSPAPPTTSLPPCVLSPKPPTWTNCGASREKRHEAISPH